jgi:adenylate cyclase
VERFVDAVQHTLPDDARVVKTIGDEVMVVAGDAPSLVDWAVGFQSLHVDRPLPRIGIHHGPGALPRRRLLRPGGQPGGPVGARAAGGEVLVTRPVVGVAGRHLQFTRVGEVKLKGFAEATELFLAGRGEPR